MAVKHNIFRDAQSSLFYTNVQVVQIPWIHTQKGSLTIAFSRI